MSISYLFIHAPIHVGPYEKVKVGPCSMLLQHSTIEFY